QTKMRKRFEDEPARPSSAGMPAVQPEVAAEKTAEEKLPAPEDAAPPAPEQNLIAGAPAFTSDQTMSGGIVPGLQSMYGGQSIAGQTMTGGILPTLAGASMPDRTLSGGLGYEPPRARRVPFGLGAIPGAAPADGTLSGGLGYDANSAAPARRSGDHLRAS